MQDMLQKATDLQLQALMQVTDAIKGLAGLPRSIEPESPKAEVVASEATPLPGASEQAIGGWSEHL
jgi:hypothetical protein